MIQPKSKAAKMRSALETLAQEYPQNEGMGRAISAFLSGARPGHLFRLYEIVQASETKAEALAKLGA